MRVGKHILHRALAWAAAEPAAVQEGIERLVGLIGVAGGRIEKAVDARGHVRHGKIGGRDSCDAGYGERSDPEEIDAGHEEQSNPDDADEKRLAEIRLHYEQNRKDGVKRERKLEPGDVAALLAFVEQ